MTKHGEWQALKNAESDRWFVVRPQRGGTYLTVATNLDKSTAHKIAAVNELVAALENARNALLLTKSPRIDGMLTPEICKRGIDAINESAAALAKARQPLPEPPQ